MVVGDVSYISEVRDLNNPEIVESRQRYFLEKRHGFEAKSLNFDIEYHLKNFHLDAFKNYCHLPTFSKDVYHIHTPYFDSFNRSELVVKNKSNIAGHKNLESSPDIATESLGIFCGKNDLNSFTPRERVLPIISNSDVENRNYINHFPPNEYEFALKRLYKMSSDSLFEDETVVLIRTDEMALDLSEIDRLEGMNCRIKVVKKVKKKKRSQARKRGHDNLSLLGKDTAFNASDNPPHPELSSEEYNGGKQVPASLRQSLKDDGSTINLKNGVNGYRDFSRYTYPKSKVKKPPKTLKLEEITSYNENITNKVVNQIEMGITMEFEDPSINQSRLPLSPSLMTNSLNDVKIDKFLKRCSSRVRTPLSPRLFQKSKNDRKTITKIPISLSHDLYSQTNIGSTSVNIFSYPRRIIAIAKEADLIPNLPILKRYRVPTKKISSVFKNDDKNLAKTAEKLPENLKSNIEIGKNVESSLLVRKIEIRKKSHSFEKYKPYKHRRFPSEIHSNGFNLDSVNIKNDIVTSTSNLYNIKNKTSVFKNYISGDYFCDATMTVPSKNISTISNGQNVYIRDGSITTFQKSKIDKKDKENTHDRTFPVFKNGCFSYVKYFNAQRSKLKSNNTNIFRATCEINRVHNYPRSTEVKEIDLSKQIHTKNVNLLKICTLSTTTNKLNLNNFPKDLSNIIKSPLLNFSAKNLDHIFDELDQVIRESISNISDNVVTDKCIEFEKNLSTQFDDQFKNNSDKRSPKIFLFYESSKIEPNVPTNINIDSNIVSLISGELTKEEREYDTFDLSNNFHMKDSNSVYSSIAEPVGLSQNCCTLEIKNDPSYVSNYLTSSYPVLDKLSYTFSKLKDQSISSGLPSFPIMNVNEFNTVGTNSWNNNGTTGSSNISITALQKTSLASSKIKFVNYFDKNYFNNYCGNYKNNPNSINDTLKYATLNNNFLVSDIKPYNNDSYLIGHSNSLTKTWRPPSRQFDLNNRKTSTGLYVILDQIDKYPLTHTLPNSLKMGNTQNLQSRISFNNPNVRQLRKDELSHTFFQMRLNSANNTLFSTSNSVLIGNNMVTSSQLSSIMWRPKSNTPANHTYKNSSFNNESNHFNNAIHQIDYVPQKRWHPSSTLPYKDVAKQSKQKDDDLGSIINDLCKRLKDANKSLGQVHGLHYNMNPLLQ
ncbi:unnamed protein product [Gordionus sp. m RMFG-2023]